ncbi:c-type cytochrome [Roseibacillus ishigakijimensis]|uniref:C-type cytochrome n=1 Tax=Roseibacillus ishigakijimensis TaxID=454146 RepID=A0A934RR03_9BACT|nr:c-type cytochrome [Roseibacillus ishigakijimensis]MBK1832941.1 c-type cytochrome [Roseibacillus ishigakijimensis]
MKQRFFDKKALVATALAIFSGAGLRAAEPTGEALYGLYCAACHGPDGKGAAGAPFPPLAGSEWVRGDARRMISVILHGLEEPVLVRAKTYNLQMPPQGSVLSDEQIASIASHVRSSWGNRDGAVKPELVAEVRAENATRESLWTAPELLMKHPLPPLPRHRWGVSNLTVTVYEGEWEEMPDFSQLTSVSEEKEEGPISLSQAGGRKENFAVVWEGTMESPGDHDSNFFVSSVGGLRLIYNGQEVFHLKGQGQHYRHTSARAKAVKGTNSFRLEYFQKGPRGGLALHRSGGSMGLHPLTDTDRDADAKDFPDIFLFPENGRSTLYRNTIEGVSPRAIGVGLEGGINYGFSASTLALELLWQGKFINAGQHWTVRGTGATPPAGEQVVSLGRGLGIGPLPRPSGQKWPRAFPLDWQVLFLGYDLDEQNRPAFRYRAGELLIVDQPLPGEGESPSLQRKLTITVPPTGAGDWALRLVSGQELQAREDGFLVNGALTISASAPGALQQRGSDLYLSLAGLTAGEHSLAMTYTWIQP